MEDVDLQSLLSVLENIQGLGEFQNQVDYN